MAIDSPCSARARYTCCVTTVNSNLSGPETIEPASSVAARLTALARDIKISHTVFAMPFALLATFLAAEFGDGQGNASVPGVPTLALIVVCMVLARTMAMAFNRWADARIDSKNPRTAKRAVPSGKLSPAYMLGVSIVCAGLFIATCSGFWLINGNEWPIILSPAVAAFLIGYSFTKRFTWLCHLYLGTALAISPVAACIAVNPGYLSQAEPFLLAGMVICWVAGFDIIYALQDVETDRRDGINSMPANLGETTALWISRTLHLLCIVALIVLTVSSEQLGIGFRAGVVVAAALLVLEHALVWRSKTNHINMAFFTVNGVISLLLGGAGIVDILSG